MSELEPEARFLLGRLSEHAELLSLVDERPGLLILAADPLSGTSLLLEHVAADVRGPAIIADARGCSDAMDLAMRIADSAVDRFAPSIASWWRMEGARYETAGLQLQQRMGAAGVDLEDLRLGSGSGLNRLRDALELSTMLVSGEPLTVIIDHLEDLLNALGRRPTLELLAELRALLQRPGAPGLALVGRPNGPLSEAQADPDHPMFRAGQIFRLRRPSPERFAEDLAIGQPWTAARAPMLLRAAQLAEGVPVYTWKIIDLALGGGFADEDDDSPLTFIDRAWEHLWRLNAAPTLRTYALLGEIHRVAPAIVSALATGVGPYEIPAADKLVRDALARLAANGVVWAPAPRTWRVADPLLARCARSSRAPWLERRARSQVAGHKG